MQLLHLIADIVLKSSMLLPGLALKPVFFFDEAHSAVKLFCLDAV